MRFNDFALATAKKSIGLFIAEPAETRKAPWMLFIGGNRAGSEPRRVADQKIEEFPDWFASPYVAAERGYVDAVIQGKAGRFKGSCPPNGA